MNALAQAAKRWHTARDRERQAAAALHEAIRLAISEGTSEVDAARIAGVDRGTVRRAIGKART
jgi:predicted DNA-binding protein (UPF0251 family)